MTTQTSQTVYHYLDIGRLGRGEVVRSAASIHLPNPASETSNIH